VRRNANVGGDGDSSSSEKSDNLPEAGAARRNAELDGSIGLQVLHEEENAAIEYKHTSLL
jgi:hypothetical protein